MSAMSDAQHHAVEDAVAEAARPLPAPVRVRPQHPVGLLNGKCAQNEDGTFVWTFDLLDRFGKVITLIGRPDQHATAAIRSLVGGNLVVITDEQFRQLVGPS